MLPISKYYTGIIFLILLSACGDDNSGFPKSECGGDINPCASYPVSLEVTPETLKSPTGIVIQYLATVTLSDGEQLDVTNNSTWLVDNTTVASISNTGMLTTLSAGNTTITATYNALNGLSVSDEAALIVNDVDLIGLEVTPSKHETLVGLTVNYQAWAKYQTGDLVNVTSSSSWSLSKPSIADIQTQGDGSQIILAKSVGVTDVSAQFKTFNSNGQLAVIDSPVNALVITPVNAKLPQGTEKQYQANLVLDNGQSIDVTLFTQWAIDNSQIGSFSNTYVFSANTPGTTTIDASFTYDDIALTDVTEVTVVNAQAERLLITPQDGQFPLGSQGQFEAFALYTNGDVLEVTNQTTWNFSDPIGTIETDGEQAGYATATGIGTTNVNANFNNLVASTTAEVTAAQLVELTLTPLNYSTPAGTQVVYQGFARFTDNSSHDITQLGAWSSSEKDIAKIGFRGATSGVASTFLPGETVICVNYMSMQACTELTVTDAVANKLVITPVNVKVPLGINGQFNATAYYTNGRSQDVTKLTTWQSANLAVASISPTGLNAGFTTSKSVGESTILANFEALTDETKLTITDAELTDLVISPVNASIPKGTKQNYTLTGIYSDGSYDDLTLTANWQTNNSEIAYFAKAGIASGAKEGTAAIIAAINGLSAEAALTVTAAELSYIAVSPKSRTVPAGNFAQFSAVAHYTDLTNNDVSGQATWSSQNSAIASVVTSGGLGGQVSAISEGETFVTAYFNNQSDNATVTVSQAVLEQVVIFPKSQTIVAGEQQTFTLTAIFSNGKHEVVTNYTDWQSNETSVATIDSLGVATSHIQGTTQITGTYQGMSDQANLIVSEAEITRLQVTPKNSSVPSGTQGQFSATAFFSDGNSQVVTTQALWQSDNTNSVKVNANGVQAGLATAFDPGTALVSASYKGKTASAEVVVSAAELVEIQITPVLFNTFLGDEVTYTAIGLYSNNDSLIITDFVSWRSSEPNVANFKTVNSKASPVVATYAEGQTIITASYLGKISNNATLTVTPALLERLVVYPSPQEIPVGTNAQFLAHAYFSDGNNDDVTDLANWRADDISVASHNGVGEFITLAKGNTTVVAEYKSLESTAELSVTEATLDTLTISPISSELNVDESQAFQTFASFSDGNSYEVTLDSTWQVADAIASVDVNGLVTAQAVGETKVLASYQGQTVQADLLIAEKEVVRIEIRPASVEVYVNDNTQLRAYAIHADLTDTDITELATWSSSAPFTANVVATGVKAGYITTYNLVATVDIKVALNGQQDSSTVTVIQKPPTPTSLLIEPNNETMRTFEDLQLKAYVLFNNNTFFRDEVTETATWSLSNPDLAYVSKPGLIHALKRGELVVTARYAGFSKTANITIRDELAEYIEITPLQPEVPVDTVGRFTAMAFYPSGREEDVTTKTTWKSDDEDIVHIVSFSNDGGTATALKAGVTDITANFGGVIATTSVTVTDTELSTVYIDPDNFQLNVNEQQNLTAFAVFANGDEEEVTLDGDWLAADNTIASVNQTGNTINALGVNSGNTTITFSYQGKSATADVEVISAKLQSITIEPEDLSIAIDEDFNFVATGFYDNGDERDITTQVTWSVKDSQLAAIESSTGLFTGKSRGFTEVYAELQGKKATAYVNVSFYILSSTVIRPDVLTLTVGESKQLRCFNIYALADDEFVNYEEEITQTAAWTLGFSEEIASVGAAGLITGVKAGTNSVECRYSLGDDLNAVGSIDLTVTN
jgi:hypothetical protein